MCLLIKIDRFLRLSGMSRSQFGRLSINDPRLVTDMMRGRAIGRETQIRIERFIDSRRV